MNASDGISSMPVSGCPVSLTKLAWSSGLFKAPCIENVSFKH